MFCYSRVHANTISFLGTFFGSSDPTSDQYHTMSFFDEPEDDPFADLNEEEHRLGLVGQEAEEQELDWEQLLPSVDDEAQLASLFEVADQPDQSHGQSCDNQLQLPLTTNLGEDDSEEARDPVIAEEDPYLIVGMSEDHTQVDEATPSRTRRFGECMEDDIEPQLPEIETPKPKRIRLMAKTPPKDVPPVAVVDPNKSSMSDLRHLVMKFSGCEKVRDFFYEDRATQIEGHQSHMEFFCPDKSSEGGMVKDACP